MSFSTVKMGDIALAIQPGPFGSQLHSSDYSEEGTPIIMPKDMIDGQINHSNLAFVSEEHVKRLSRHQVHNGDLMVARKGDVRKCVYITENEEGWMTGSDCLKVELDERRCYPRYIYYQLRSPYIGKWLETISIGATMPSINTGLLSNIELFLPTMDTQKRIASVLLDYDRLIKNNQKQIKLLEEAAQRLYKEWFVDFRFPGHEDVEIINGVPEGWSLRPVSSFGEVVTGKTPTTSKSEYYGGSIPFVKIPDMHGVVFPILTEATLTEQGAESQKNKYIPKNSIMVSCIATVGLVNISVTSCQTNQQINSLILNDQNNLYYIYSSLKRIKELLDGVGSNGATMTNVNKTKFEGIEVLYPNRELVEKYQTFCDSIYDKIFILSVKILQLQEARDRLLPKLMSGEIEL